MFYIYHIPGVKIGCSDNPNRRVKAQKYTNYEILETHTDIEVAANREIELQKQYGYDVDKGSRVYSNHFFSNMGKKGGSKQTQKQKQASSNNAKKSKSRFDFKLQSELGKRGQLAQNIELTCPHCGKVGIGRVMYRHHFNRCKLNPNP